MRHSIVVTALVALLSFPALDASAQGRAARTTPSRDGLFLQGGGWFHGGGAYGRPWFRAEAGIHLRRLSRSDLYLQIPAMITSASYGFAGYENSFLGFALVPGVRGEWTLLNTKGDLAVFLEGGAGIQMYRWRWGNTSGPADRDTWVHGILRTGAGVVYTAPFGLMVTAQVAGFGFAIGGGRRCVDGVCVDANYNGAFYDGALMIGYRWE